MRRSNTHGFVYNDLEQSQNKQFLAQMKKVYLAFYKQPKSMLMVEAETGVMRSNICWYVRKWRNSSCIKVVKYSICKISKRRVGFYSTNPELFENKNQTKLFEND